MRAANETGGQGDGSIQSFADIAKHRDMPEGKIYGIEPGNDGNRLIQSMIDKDAFGLKGFEVVESSEQGMLAQVARAIRREGDALLLDWSGRNRVALGGKGAPASRRPEP